VQRWMRWSTKIFVATALVTLASFLVERDRGPTLPSWIIGPVIWAAVLALPGAAAGVVKQSDRRSRVLWLMVLTVCVALAGAMLFFVQ